MTSPARPSGIVGTGWSAGRVAFEAAADREPATGVANYVRRLGAALHDVLGPELALLGLRADAQLRETAPEAAMTDFRGRHRLTWLVRHADADARRTGARVLHYTHAASALERTIPHVVTIQDLSLFRMPWAHPPLRIASAPLYAIAARSASAVIVPSVATREEVVRLFAVDRARIAVIGHAPSWDPTALPADSHAVRERLGLRGSYVLSTGPLEPRKNHLRLVHAFEQLAREDPELWLVIVGGSGWRGDSIAAAIRRSPAAARIVFAGYLPAPVFRTLLVGASTLAYVSLYEGYGLPILEAMAAGVPVVASGVSSMPEAAGGAAVLVNPTDPSSIASGLRQALGRREALSAAGRRRVAELSWASVAGSTLAVYERVLAGAPVDDVRDRVVAAGFGT